MTSRDHYIPLVPLPSNKSCAPVTSPNNHLALMSERVYGAVTNKLDNSQTHELLDQG